MPDLARFVAPPHEPNPGLDMVAAHAELTNRAKSWPGSARNRSRGAEGVVAHHARARQHLERLQ